MAERKLYQDEEWLREKYWDEELSIRQIASLAECSGSIIRQWMKRFDIPSRGYIEANCKRWESYASNTLHCDKEWLERKYWDEGLSMRTMAQIANCSRAAIGRWMDKYDIPRRLYNESLSLDTEWLRRKYWDEGLTLAQIGKIAGCNPSSVRDWMIKQDIPTRTYAQSASKVMARGNHPMHAPEARAKVHLKMAENMKAAWAQGKFDGVSEAVRAAWARGAYDGVSKGVKAAWARGAYDGVFQSPTSIEIEAAEALDALSIEHQGQYRPDGYSRIYDEFVSPNILIEVQGNYWHTREGVAERDAEKAAWAKANDYHLVAIWEHEIKEQSALALIQERVLPLLMEEK